jgi:hypothetical protein
MSLFNSMVRGFGSQIGRRAANHMIDSKPAVASKSQWVIAGLLLFIFVGFMSWVMDESKKTPKVHKKTPKVQASTTQINLPKSETYKGHTVYTGKRGGKYYYSKGGKKVYIY